VQLEAATCARRQYSLALLLPPLPSKSYLNSRRGPGPRRGGDEPWSRPLASEGQRAERTAAPILRGGAARQRKERFANRNAGEERTAMREQVRGISRPVVAVRRYRCHRWWVCSWRLNRVAAFHRPDVASSILGVG